MNHETTISVPPDAGNPLCTRVECLAPCAGCFEDPGGGFLNCKRFDVARHLADNNEGDPVQVPRRRYQRMLATQLSDPGNPAVTAEPAPVPSERLAELRRYMGVAPGPLLSELVELEQTTKALRDEIEWKRRAIDAEHDRDRALDRLREVNGINASLQSRIHDL